MGGGEGRAEYSQSEVEVCGAFSQRGEGFTISTVFMNFNDFTKVNNCFSIYSETSI